MGSLSAIGRGRGRGTRGRGILLKSTPQRNVLAEINPPSVGDAVDGCAAQKPRSFVQDFGDRYKDDPENDRDMVKLEPESSNSVSGNVNKEESPGLSDQREEKNIPMKVLSVNLLEKYAEMKFLDRDLTEKCEVRVYESPKMKKWFEENHLLSKVNSLPENALLSTLEMNIGEELTATEVRHNSEDGCVVFIDFFNVIKFRNDFFNSLLFFMVPRLPSVNLHSVGVITNLRGMDEIDVVFYRQLWVGMKETVQSLQIEKKLLTPRCHYLRELFKELMNGFGVSFFLASLNDNWSELQRVQIIEKVSDDMVKVNYVDLGKVADISIECLAMPLPSNFMPELIDKIPPQSVRVRVKNLDLRPNYQAALMSLRHVLEGRVCYIQTISDDTNPPLVDIVVTNSTGTGTVSLSELVAACANQGRPLENENFKASQLTVVQKKLDDMREKWAASFLKDRPANGYVHQCACCKNTRFGHQRTSRF